MPTIRFLDGDADRELLRTLYDTVLAPSFPASEREPFDKLARVLDGEELLGAVALDPAGAPVGALFLEWFAGIRVGMLSYFAVRPDVRGRGIGRALVAAATPRWQDSLRPELIVAEAEDPRVHGGAGGDYGDATARLRMYAGFGARRLPIRYVLPELMPGEGRLPGLLLLAVTDADAVPGPVVESFLGQYYARMEGGPARPGDVQLQELLASCRQELLKLEDL